MDALHTPGPWSVAYDDKHGQAVVSGEHTEVCTCWHHSVGSLEKQMRHNAHLIAAAPDLLTELAAATAEMMGVVQRLEDAGLGRLVGGVARQCDMNRAAIARALGKEG